ncbi:alpha/beta hydrolase [Companilactobacillus allii]|uniref:Lipolytic enzyme n=1 Tax=Companilactobacillus allii TaxID=1847728 RepID=A0A1P8Q0Q0_9LACO|nr:alpha/beta hydrolase [Companilactobacillus allii]APX71401.1 lipolytic enzyme [Companilactobacillus allii]USQ68481.1 alpha/beta hydrolase [Companilactobacillus allii]
MLSEQAKQAIEIAKTIKQQQTDSLKADQVAFLRTDADNHNGVPIPNNMKLEEYHDEVKGEYYQLDNSKDDTVLLFIHGGMYATGSVKSRRNLCFGLLNRLNYDGFSVDYRQWPEAKHPAAQEDVVAAYKFLKEKYQHVVVFGESAGATLALTLTLQLKAAGEDLPDRIAVFSPVITQINTVASEFLMQERDPMLLGAGDPVPYFDNPYAKNPLVSPIYGDFTDFPPLMINCGSEEVKYDDSKILNYLCQKAGVDVTWNVWQDLFHVFVLFDMPETNQALNKIANFLK